MTKELPTIKLKGKDYVQVKDRVLFFNEVFPNGSIETGVQVKDTGDYAWFMATVIPDVTNQIRKFVARSAGPVDEEKSFEKLETVAVGRALALMGIGIIEGIASADEIVVYEKRKSIKKEPYSNVEPKEIIPENNLKPCDKCGGNFILKHGKYGDFYSCSNFKSKGCKRSIKLEDADMWLLSPEEVVSQVFNDGAPMPTSEF